MIGIPLGGTLLAVGCGIKLGRVVERIKSRSAIMIDNLLLATYSVVQNENRRVERKGSLVLGIYLL